MSWLATHDRVIEFVCKVSPKSKMCINHLMAKYPDCFKSGKSYVKVLMDMPKKMWNRVVAGNEMSPLEPGFCSICQEEDHDTAILQSAFKILFLLAASVAILYAILKATANRAPSAQ